MSNTWTQSSLDAYREEAYSIPVPRYRCMACRDLQVVRTGARLGEEGFGKLVPCECVTEEGRAARKKWVADNCGLQHNELRRSWADWRLGSWPPSVQAEFQGQRRRAETVLREALGRCGGFVTLWGDHGAGKTLALNIVVAEAARNGVEAFYSTGPGILDHIRSMIGANRDTSEFWERLLTIPVLAVDEVTRFHDTDWAQERIFVLVDTRYRLAQAGTHLTTWATNDDPHKALPPAETLGYMYSRMRDAAIGTLLELRGDVRAAIGGRR